MGKKRKFCFSATQVLLQAASLIVRLFEKYIDSASFVTGCSYHCDPRRWHLWFQLHQGIYLPILGGYPRPSSELDPL